MFRALPGRLIGGIVWGIGAGLGLSLVRMRSGDRASDVHSRQMAKTLIRAYVETADRLKDWTAEKREVLEDLYTEVQVERRDGNATHTPGHPEEGAGAVPGGNGSRQSA